MGDRKSRNLDENCVATEELELLHGVGVERDYGVVIVDGFVDNKTIRRLLPLEDSCAEVLLRFPVIKNRA